MIYNLCEIFKYGRSNNIGNIYLVPVHNYFSIKYPKTSFNKEPSKYPCSVENESEIFKLVFYSDQKLNLVEF